VVFLTAWYGSRCLTIYVSVKRAYTQNFHKNSPKFSTAERRKRINRMLSHEFSLQE